MNRLLTVPFFLLIGPLLLAAYIINFIGWHVWHNEDTFIKYGDWSFAQWEPPVVPEPVEEKEKT